MHPLHVPKMMTVTLAFIMFILIFQNKITTGTGIEAVPGTVSYFLNKVDI